ncbi:MAG: hypothetical protein LUE19_09115, partial [Clostridiales bacterium]|nr:hypothetical protein [Clostridiales bacterium]
CHLLIYTLYVSDVSLRILIYDYEIYEIIGQSHQERRTDRIQYESTTEYKIAHRQTADLLFSLEEKGIKV